MMGCVEEVRMLVPRTTRSRAPRAPRRVRRRSHLPPGSPTSGGVSHVRRIADSAVPACHRVRRNRTTRAAASGCARFTRANDARRAGGNPRCAELDGLAGGAAACVDDDPIVVG